MNWTKRHASCQVVLHLRRAMVRPMGRFPDDRLMSDGIEFEIVCPNDHDQTVTFNGEEFEKAQKSGALVFHCNTCDTDWPPSSKEIDKLRKQFSKNR